MILKLSFEGAHFICFLLMYCITEGLSGPSGPVHLFMFTSQNTKHYYLYNRTLLIHYLYTTYTTEDYLHTTYTAEHYLYTTYTTEHYLHTTYTTEHYLYSTHE